MKKRYVLPTSCLPNRLPVIQGLVGYLWMDFYNAPGWAWGMMWTLYALLCVGAIVGMVRDVEKPLPGYGEADQ